MLTKLSKWLLFISSYTPLYVLLLIQNIEWEVKPFNIKYIIKYNF